MACHAVIPAAGVGKRFGAGMPKQYLMLAGRSIQQHTLDRLGAMSEISQIVVAISAEDTLAQTLPYARPERLRFVPGGAERMDSVLAGLRALRASGAADSDWVLVHDVARPLLRPADVRHLLTALADDPIGGILANPVRDTMKRGSADGIEATVARDNLWHALTPQMFRLGALAQALEAALADAAIVTDEASAMERLGHRPRLVEGARDNIKITFPDDLALAEALLAEQIRTGVWK
ncbi:MAG: 2-C-methyl-D-erythritol 4-phosphate cytidylyltransferase [Pseudomonadota bacterium]|mgnify:FL=1